MKKKDLKIGMALTVIHAPLKKLESSFNENSENPKPAKIHLASGDVLVVPLYLYNSRKEAQEKFNELLDFCEKHYQQSLDEEEK